MDGWNAHDHMSYCTTPPKMFLTFSRKYCTISIKFSVSKPGYPSMIWKFSQSRALKRVKDPKPVYPPFRCRAPARALEGTFVTTELTKPDPEILRHFEVSKTNRPGVGDKQRLLCAALSVLSNRRGRISTIAFPGINLPRMFVPPGGTDPPTEDQRKSGFLELP